MNKLTLQKGEPIGIYFNNGIQAIAYVDDYDDHCVRVDKLLGIQLGYNLWDGSSVSAQEIQQMPPEQLFGADYKSLSPEEFQKRQPRPAVYFENITPYADADEKGITSEIPFASIMMTFPLEKQLLSGYKNRVSSIQIVGAGALHDLQR